MNLLKRLLKICFFSYLIYVFIFAFLIYGYHKPTNKNDVAYELQTTLNSNTKEDRLALIETAEDAINVRLDLIENAEKDIDISYYKFVDGKVSDLVLGSILDAADRGVKVRILLDGIIQLGNLGGKMNNILLGFDSHPNIELKLWEPLNLLLPISWNNRLHDKMIIVDNELALIGGRNIEDRFYLMEEYGDKFVKDRDVLIYNEKIKSENVTKESVIDDIKSYYEQLWEHKYSKAKYRYMSKRRINKGEKYIKNLRSEHKSYKKEFLKSYFDNMKIENWKDKTIPTKGVCFISNPISRLNSNPKCLKAVMELSSQSKENIIIQSPYVVPSRGMRSLFNQYEVDLELINLLTNSSASSPNIAAFSGYTYYKKQMIDNGLNIYEYQGPGSIHAKTAIFDRKISMVGTLNIDPRSSYLNTESMLIINSEDFSEYLIEEMENNLNHSLKVDKDYSYLDTIDLPVYKTSKLKKIFIKIVSKLTPIFENLL